MKPIPILLYHSIAEQADAHFRRWVVSPEHFAQQLSWLRTNHYQSLTISDLVARIRKNTVPERCVALTFDDGFADNFTDALPLLKRYDMTATLYVSTAYIGGTSRWLQMEGEGRRPMLTWEQLTRLRDAGVEIGAHTHTHPQLDTLSMKAARAEIQGSKEALERQLAQPIATFAYPHGYYSRAVREAVRGAGFSSACGVKHAFSSLHDDVYALARIIVPWGTDAMALQRLLSDCTLPIAPDQRAFQPLRQIAWRWMRQAKKQWKPQPN